MPSGITTALPSAISRLSSSLNRRLLNLVSWVVDRSSGMDTLSLPIIFPLSISGLTRGTLGPSEMTLPWLRTPPVCTADETRSTIDGYYYTSYSMLTSFTSPVTLPSSNPAACNSQLRFFTAARSPLSCFFLEGLGLGGGDVSSARVCI